MRRTGSGLWRGQQRPPRAGALATLLAASAALASVAARAEEPARLPPPVAVERAPAEQRVGTDRFEARSPVTITFGLDGVFVPAGVGGGAGLSLWAGARVWTGEHLNLGVVAGGTFVSGPGTIDVGSPPAGAGLVRFVAARVELYSERDGFYPMHALYAQAGPALLGAGVPGIHAAFGLHLPSRQRVFGERSVATGDSWSSALLATLLPAPTHVEVQFDLPLDGSRALGPRFLVGYAF